ncbi:MAG: hypothetical protein KY464_07315 [Gemmatimonadetes bacterium]|nr:hypothetical protein [Gemmatimonadota bacterium]
MHKAFRYILLLLGLMLFPMQLDAQEQEKPGHSMSGRGRFYRIDRGPVQFLLRNRAELRLTAEQVVKLQEIDRQMEEKNQPYVTQLVQMRRQLPQLPRGREPTAEQREAFEAQMRAAEPLLKKIHENNAVSMRQVGDVLSEDQKQRIPVLLANERRLDGRRDQSRRESDDRN